MKSSAKDVDVLTPAVTRFKAAQRVARKKTKKGAGGREDAAAAAPATTGERRAEEAQPEEEVVRLSDLPPITPEERAVLDSWDRAMRPPQYAQWLPVPPSEPVENRTMQVGTRYPVAMLEMIDQAVAGAPAEFVTRADFIRRAVENELRRRALLPSYQEPRGPKPRKSAFD